MTRHARFLAHVGAHEIRPAVVSGVCACGMSPVDRAGRCVACEDRRADRLLELGLGHLDGEES